MANEMWQNHQSFSPQLSAFNTEDLGGPSPTLALQPMSTLSTY